MIDDIRRALAIAQLAGCNVELTEGQLTWLLSRYDMMKRHLERIRVPYGVFARNELTFTKNTLQFCIEQAQQALDKLDETERAGTPD